MFCLFGPEPGNLTTVIRVRHFRGGVSNFNQSEARKRSVLSSDWLKFVTLPQKYRTLLLLNNIELKRNFVMKIDSDNGSGQIIIVNRNN